MKVASVSSLMGEKIVMWRWNEKWNGVTEESNFSILLLLFHEIIVFDIFYTNNINHHTYSNFYIYIHHKALELTCTLFFLERGAIK